MNFTIIIPHKNIPHLLKRCLDSIPQRIDTQIIVIDDNSNILEIDDVNLLYLPEKYPNVQWLFSAKLIDIQLKNLIAHINCLVIHNGSCRKGAGYARNLGLEHAKGKWIIFADADDFFNKNINTELNNYIDNQNDIIFFRAESFNLQTNSVGKRHVYINGYIDKIKKSGKWRKAIFLHTPWGKFIKRDLIEQNNLRFEEIPSNNDFLFGVKTNFLAKGKIISDSSIYTVTERKKSLSHTKNPINILLKCRTLLKILIFFIRH